MSVATYQPVAHLGPRAMDNDRKRAATAVDFDDSSAPPLKKQVTISNGASDAVDVPRFGSTNSNWQVDLETIQKDAILRQLKEYKREKLDLEKTLRELQDASKYHDDHLRLIDSWWHQLIDEVAVLITHQPAQDEGIPFETSSLLLADSENFKAHLASRTDKIKKVISAIYSKAAAPSPDAQALQKRVNDLLAREKLAVAESQRLTVELEQQQARLEDSAFRYMVAEKKLDRAKSQAVQALEKQGALGSQVVKQESDEKVNGDGTNGIKVETNGVASEELEQQAKEAIAGFKKAKEQLAALEAQNLKLTSELTANKARLDSLTDEDYAGTELFRIAKSKLEEYVAKINDLEATHIQLREEAKKMQAERTAYRTKVDEEASIATTSTETLLANRDADLQRIRASRDDLHSRLEVAQQSVVERKGTVEQAKALSAARQDRVTALEHEVERLKLRCGELHAGLNEEDLNTEDIDALKQKVADLRRECSMLEGELPSIEQAYKKAQAVAAAKIKEHTNIDEQLLMLKQGKARADQKYFGIMKLKDQLVSEVATLRKSEKTSSGIITSLKDADARRNELVINLERQIAEQTDAIQRMDQDRFALEAKASQADMLAKEHASQVIKVKASLSEKDAAISALESGSREAHREVEALKTRLEHEQKQTATWKKKASESTSDEVLRLRTVAYCHCGRALKNTVIQVCGHIVCRECVQDRLTSRQRKCPICMKAFGQNDHMQVHLV